MQSAGIFLRIIDTAFDSFDSSFVQLYFCCFTGSLMGYFLGFLLKFDQRWIAFSVAAALTVNFTFFFFFFLSLSTESQRIPQAPHWTLWRLASESWRSRSSEETDTSVWSAWYEHTACWTSHSKPPMPKRDGYECTLTPAQSRFLRLQWRCKSRHYRDIGKTKDLNPVKYILLCTTLQEECFPLFLNFFPTHIFIRVLSCTRLPIFHWAASLNRQDGTRIKSRRSSGTDVIRHHLWQSLIVLNEPARLCVFIHALQVSSSPAGSLHV